MDNTDKKKLPCHAHAMQLPPHLFVLEWLFLPLHPCSSAQHNLERQLRPGAASASSPRLMPNTDGSTLHFAITRRRCSPCRLTQTLCFSISSPTPTLRFHPLSSAPTSRIRFTLILSFTRHTVLNCTVYSQYSILPYTRFRHHSFHSSYHYAQRSSILSPNPFNQPPIPHFFSP